jgi:serine/threonine protein kinase
MGTCLDKIRGPCDPQRRSSDEVAAEIFQGQAPSGEAGAEKAARWRRFNEAQAGKQKRTAKEFLSNYNLGKRLNAGAQGVTYLATRNIGNEAGNTVVVKRPNDPIDVSDFTALQDKTHPHVVRVFDLFCDDHEHPTDTYIVMECCKGGDLFEAFESLGHHADLTWCANVIAQVSKGVSYLHGTCNSCHNDIKPENILLDRPCTTLADVPRVMVGDFGCLSPLDKISVMDGGGGDPRYRAPEVHSNPRHLFGAKTDVWSVGVTLFEIASGGYMPYINQPNLAGWAKFSEYQGGEMARTMMGRLAQTPCKAPDLSWAAPNPSLHKALKAMLSPQPDHRPAMAALLQDPFIRHGSEVNQTKRLLFGTQTSALLQERSKKHKLHKFLIDMIGHKLQGESLDYYREIWDQYDTQGDGVMGRAQFDLMVHEQGICPPDGKTADQFFKFADRDKTGQIDFHEFVALTFNAHAIPEAEKLRYFRSVFQDLADDDGLIHLETFAEHFGNPQRGSKEWTKIENLFNQIDVNHDESVDLAEFEAYVDIHVSDGQ